RWAREGEDFVAGAALARAGDALYVVRFCHVSSGATLARYELATGVERWRRRLTGLGPIGHSEYLNAAQLEASDARVVVYGWESAGRYVEVIRPADGAERGVWREADGGWSRVDVPATAAWSDQLTSEAPPLGAAQGVVWPTGGAPPDASPRPVEVRQDGFLCRFEPDDGVELSCAEGDTTRWRIATAGGLEGGALTIVDDRLIVARWHPIASGTWVYAYDLESGRELWRRGLWGVGPVTHSRYRNHVRLARRGEHLVVFGDETAGRYVEVLQATTGRVLGHRRLPAE
ncbi:MAG TPA: hypothetical protein RMH99_24820, partial [Sandaracinaceae bacterium LLY-WYZ-13_1]|nr:hypothetical protein [Sandaracinaceae bacterium LLY-WYZ-13_1]